MVSVPVSQNALGHSMLTPGWAPMPSVHLWARLPGLDSYVTFPRKAVKTPKTPPFQVELAT